MVSFAQGKRLHGDRGKGDSLIQHPNSLGAREVWNLAGEGERPQAWSPPTVPHSGWEGHPQLGTGEKCTEMPSEPQKQFKDPRTGGISKGSETPTFTPTRPGLVWPGVSGWLLPGVTPCSACSGRSLPRALPPLSDQLGARVGEASPAGCAAQNRIPKLIACRRSSSCGRTPGRRRARW